MHAECNEFAHLFIKTREVEKASADAGLAKTRSTGPDAGLLQYPYIHMLVYPYANRLWLDATGLRMTVCAAAFV